MLPALLAAIAGLGFCWYCTSHHAPAIQDDILTRTRQALEAAHIPAAGLAVDGRDIVLKGVHGSPEVSARARELAESVWGRNTVRVEETAAPAAAAAAAPPPPPIVSEVQNKLNEIVRLRNVQFQSGSAELTVEGAATLNQVAEALSKSTALTISISGHTDSSGDAAANQALSEARAQAVKKYLASKGVTASRMTAIGFGQTKPIADNATPDGRRRNRRIEFGVTGGGQAEIEPAH